MNGKLVSPGLDSQDLSDLPICGQHGRLNLWWILDHDGVYGAVQQGKADGFVHAIDCQTKDIFSFVRITPEALEKLIFETPLFMFHEEYNDDRDDTPF